MKHTLIAFSTLMLCLSSFAVSADTQVRRLKVPASVHTAVDENYDFGRNLADFGGISGVRYFKGIKNSTFRNLKATVRYLLENEKGNISEVCYQLSVSECASRFANGEYGEWNYLVLHTGDDDHQEMIDFDQNIMLIDAFVKEKTPESKSFSACENVWSVDVCTTIQISPSTGKIVTVDFDYGA